MQTHPFSDRLLPTNAKLATHLGTSIVMRETLHQWPLSCVERVTLADGTTRICKSISGPLLEPEFYRSVSSDLLPRCEVLHHDGKYAVLLLEDVNAPRADHLELTPADAFALADRVTRRIQALPRPYPVFMDLSSPARWRTIADSMCARLADLIAAGDFGSLQPGDVARVHRACQSPRLLAVLGAEAGLIHADLNAENLFVAGDKIKVIDWQFPRLGPRGVDIATFLLSRGIEPADFVDGAYVALLHLLRMEWFVQCTVRWFPAGRETYARQIGGDLEETEGRLERV
jgi:hypothetical protein